MKNKLHYAARAGSTERTVALLRRGEINIDEGDSSGNTPLMEASFRDFSHVVRILLNKGANVAILK